MLGITRYICVVLRGSSYSPKTSFFFQEGESLSLGPGGEEGRIIKKKKVYK
jgi:hypothetical protein